jgi:hypothetical protein
MPQYDDHITPGETPIRQRRNGRKQPIDYVAIEEARHERTYLSEWLHDKPIQHDKVKPLALRLR